MSEVALELAERFHEAYERLAPEYGYETRPETRTFDRTSPNGKLMVAVCEEILRQDREASRGIEPALFKKKIREASELLGEIGVCPTYVNQMSALTLLVILGIKPETPWFEAGNPLLGVTQMMDFFREHYGKSYAPNTRETVRKQAVHQFLEAGVVAANPDQPARPMHSPKTVYQVRPSVLALARSFGARTWKEDIEAYRRAG